MLKLQTDKLSRQAQLMFLMDLSDWLSRHFNLAQTLQMMHACAEELADKSTVLLVQHIQTKLAQGRKLHECLPNYFDSDLVLVIKSSHNPQQLKKSVYTLQNMHKDQVALLQMGLKKLLYPCLLLLASVLAVWFSGKVILPRLETMMSTANVLFWSQQLKGLAWITPWLFLTGALGVIGLLLIASVSAYKYGSSVWQCIGELCRSRILRLFIVAKICFSLGVLLRQQISLSEAVNLLQEQATGQALQHYQHMQASLTLGLVSLPDIMHSNIVDRLTLMRLQMSSGSTQERSEQLREIGVSVQQRAVRRMQKHLWTLTVTCYSLAFILILVLALGLGQAVSSMFTEWM